MDYFELMEALASRKADKQSHENADVPVTAEADAAKPDHIKKQEAEIYYLDEQVMELTEAQKKAKAKRAQVAKVKEKKKAKTKILINPSKDEV